MTEILIYGKKKTGREIELIIHRLYGICGILGIWEYLLKFVTLYMYIIHGYIDLEIIGAKTI